MVSQLHSEVIGQGLAVVVLHGLFGSKDNLKLVIRLADSQRRFQFHFLDLPNHGQSDHQASMTMRDLAAAISHYCDRQGIGEFGLIGHSLGGKIAMATAVSQPERVAFMVVMDMAPRAQPPLSSSQEHDRCLLAMAEVDQAQLRTRQQVDQALAKHIQSQLVRQFLSKSLCKNERGILTWKIDYNTLQQSKHQWAGYPIPATSSYAGKSCFIYGLASDYVVSRDRQAIFKHFPEAHLIGIDQAGHWLHAEQPKRFLEELDGFLMSLSR